MNEEIEDGTYNKKAIEELKKKEEQRNLVLRAAKKLFSDSYNENFKGNEMVLEIGSGIGFLKRNWPKEFEGTWIQLDSSPYGLEEAIKRGLNGVYVRGDTYKLPFPDESFDVVCGLSSYDVFMDLEAAIKETHRVLKEGGLFFHMLDLYPCIRPIMKDIKKKKLPIMTPGKIEGPDRYIRIGSFYFIPEENLEAFNNEYQNIINRELELGCFCGMREKEKIFKKYHKEIDTHEHFASKLINASSSYFDIETIEGGKLSAKYKGKRTKEQQQQNKDFFKFYHDAGNHFRGPRLLIDGPYLLLKPIFPLLAKILEPSCLEMYAVKYVKARK